MGDFTGDDTVGAGDTVPTFKPDDSNLQTEDKTVRVVWDDGQGSAVPFVWSGSNACIGTARRPGGTAPSR